jgi:hypothetical protein
MKYFSVSDLIITNLKELFGARLPFRVKKEKIEGYIFSKKSKNNPVFLIFVVDLNIFLLLYLNLDSY